MIITALSLSELVLTALMLASTYLSIVRSRLSTPAGIYMSCAVGWLTVWIFVRMLSHSVPVFEDKVYWMRLASVLSSLAGVFWCLFALEYARSLRPSLRKLIPLMFVVPLIGAVLHASGDSGGLMWRSIALSSVDPNWLHVRWGAGTVLVVSHQYVLMMLATVLLVRTAWRGRWREWRKNGLLISSILMPVLLNGLYATGLTGGVDLSGFGFAFVAWAWGYSDLSFRIGDVLPSRERLVEYLHEGLLVLSDDDRVVDANPAARRMLGIPRAAALTWPALLEQRLAVPPARAAEMLDFRDVQHTTELPGTPARVVAIDVHVMRHDEINLGRIVLLRDITDSARADAELRALNSDFEAQVAARTAELRDIAARLSASQEAERDRIARELHDQVGAHLSVLGMNLTMARTAVTTDSDETTTRLANAESLLQEVGVLVRRLMADLHPPELSDEGLFAALQALGAQFRARDGLQVRVTGQVQQGCLEAAASIALYRIAQESMSNVARHAQARQVTIDLVEVLSFGQVRLTISDDGVGFDPATEQKMRTRDSGWGMRTIRERAHAIGATCTIDSGIGQGTRIQVVVPCVGSQRKASETPEASA